MIKKDLRDGL